MYLYSKASIYLYTLVREFS